MRAFLELVNQSFQENSATKYLKKKRKKFTNLLKRLEVHAMDRGNESEYFKKILMDFFRQTVRQTGGSEEMETIKEHVQLQLHGQIRKARRGQRADSDTDP